MAYLTQIDTSTLSNQNLTTALLVHTYTNTSRVRKVFVGVDLAQIAGNGDYTAYATVQRAGAGSAYQMIPITVAAVDSGQTTVSFMSAIIILNTTDVLKVYVLGLAGDTTTPDITTFVWEEYVATDASGRVGLDWSNIGAPTTAQNLSGTNIDTDQIIASVTGSVDSVVDPVTIAAGQILVKRNTALNDFMFTMISSTTGNPLAGLTVTAERAIDGGAFAATTNNPAEVSDGWYSLDFAAADLNGTVIAIHLEATGAKARDFTIITQA